MKRKGNQWACGSMGFGVHHGLKLPVDQKTAIRSSRRWKDAGAVPGCPDRQVGPVLAVSPHPCMAINIRPCTCCMLVARVTVQDVEEQL